MSSAVQWESALFLTVATGAILLPGWLLGRCIGTRAPLLTAFLGGCAILFNSVLLLDALRIDLDLVSLGLVLALWILGLEWYCRRSSRKQAPNQTTVADAAKVNWLPRGTEWAWVPPIAIAIISVATRAAIDPLSGWDNITRWDHLARLMVLQKTLGHYPAITSEDFVYYPWCDGIPPLVPVLNFWLYAAGGKISPEFTAIRVVGEFVLIGVACFTLSRRWWGANAGWPALAILASSALLLWSCANGQETGMLTISLISLVLFLEFHRQLPSVSSAIWAGVAAGVGAISRDYGLTFGIFALGALLAMRATRTQLAGFAVAGAIVALPWYARNWLLTGNPIYPHALGGLLPSNPVYLEMMRGISRNWGYTSGVNTLWSIPLNLAATAGLPLILGLAGGFRGRSRTLFGIGGMGLIAILWLWALPLTAGGWTYALRVLGPAIALAGALAGWIGSAKPHLKWLMLGLALAFSVDAARRSWLLPLQPQAPIWPYRWQAWHDSQAEITRMKNPQVWLILIAEAKGQGILIDHPFSHVNVLSHGGRPIPWFSPQVRPLFEKDLPLTEIIRRLRENQVRFVTVFKDNPMTKHFRAHYPGLQEFTSEYAPTVTANRLEIYDLELLVSARGKP